MERELQGASFEPIYSFLTLFIWEISNGKVRDCKFVFALKSLTIAKNNTRLRAYITSKRIKLGSPGRSGFDANLKIFKT